MGTYCGNHIGEAVIENCRKAEHGEVTVKKTKEGTCIHPGGCNTAHDDLYQIRYSYDAKADVESRPESPPPAEPTPEREAQDLGPKEATETGTDAGPNTGTTEEKSTEPKTEEPPVTA